MSKKYDTIKSGMKAVIQNKDEMIYKRSETKEIIFWSFLFFAVIIGAVIVILWL